MDGLAMPLSTIKAETLFKEINDISFKEVIENAEHEWQSLMQPSLKPLDAHQVNFDFDELQKRLIDIRVASLNRKSVCINLDDKPVRVYNPLRKANISGDASDVFARGIDSARAVTEILKWAKLEDSHDKMLHTSKVGKKLLKLIQTYHNNMAYFIAKDMEIQNDSENLKKAIAELKRFNGALSSLLVQYKIVEERKHANNAINLIRDFLWKKDICSACCMVQPFQDYTMLRFAEPMIFGGNEYQFVNQSGPDCWQTQQPWWMGLKKRLGLHKNKESWFDDFFKAHLDSWKTLSPTPMSRSTPNPANAFDCSDIIFAAGEVISKGHHIRMAVTEPFEVKNAANRQELTNYNHLQLLQRKYLEEELNQYMENWGSLYQGDETIPFSLLHQTFIGDEVTFSPDQTKVDSSNPEASFIESKRVANKALRQFLKEHRIVRHNSSGNLQIINEQHFKEHFPQTIPEDSQEVKIEVLETNDCFNMWHARARIRNNDINDARKLIVNATTLYEKVLHQSNSDDADLATIINFLKSPDHSFFTPYKFRGLAVKKALLNLCIKLRTEPTYCPVMDGRVARENLALSLHAAVELKCTVHETWPGSFRRTVNNYTRDHFRKLPVLGHLADWLIRGTMAFSAFSLKSVINLTELSVYCLKWPFMKTNLPQCIQHRKDRKALYKAIYENLLATTLGVPTGGCVSAADRANEIAEQQAAARKQFQIEGKLISYNDSQLTKTNFLEKYGSTQAKHDFVEMATGSCGTSDDETRGVSETGLMANLETSKEQTTAKQFAQTRRGGGFDKKSSVPTYLRESCNQEKPNHSLDYPLTQSLLGSSMGSLLKRGQASQNKEIEIKGARFN